MSSNSAQARWGLAAAAIVVSVVAGGIILWKQREYRAGDHRGAAAPYL